jgi:spore coat protein H
MPMQTSPHFCRARALLLVVFVLVVRGGFAAKPPAGEDLFRDAVVPELRLEISSEGLNSLSRSPRKYVRATVKEGEKVYTNVAVHLKGGPGSFRPIQDTPAFTLNFDRFAPGQTFHGLKKVHLNNSVQDQTYLHEKISRELFEAAGVPVPRAGNAWLTFNDREFGIYVLLEGVNKQFLKRYFKDVSGNVYDGHSGSDVTTDMPTNSGENRRDKSRLRALASATREPELDARLEALEKTLDLDRFFSFVGMEMILGHWDGYTIGRNNFRIYHDRDNDRMVFLPHGLDQVLGRKFPMMPPNANGLVARAVLDIPEARKRYRERYGQLCTNVFIVESLTDRITTVAAKIDAVIARHDPEKAHSHSGAAARFARRIKERALELQNQIAPPPPIHFDGIGVARLTNWNSKLDLGQAKLNREEDSNGNMLLHISTESGCTASWRTTLDLPAGEYRFQAHVKTKGVVLPNEERAGAGLRISGHRLGQKNSGDRNWTPIYFDFEVPENKDTELVCELRAKKGDIWYDLKSLKLIRK